MWAPLWRHHRRRAEQLCRMRCGPRTNKKSAPFPRRHWRVDAMSAGIANSRNAIIRLCPRRSSFSATPTLLLDVRTASLWVLRRRCLGAGLFFLTQPWWQVIQGRLSVADRCVKLSKIYAPRSGSCSHSHVRGRFSGCLNDGVHQQRNRCH
jgi:hypothetical protein